MKTTSDRSHTGVRMAYAATLLAWLLLAVAPGQRGWGLGFLAPLGWLERILFLACAAALYVIIEATLKRRWERVPEAGEGNTRLWTVWAAAAAAAVLFLLLHGRTHFLGDSASRLAGLSEARLRGGLEFTLVLPILQAVQGFWGGEAAALRAYQLISIASGVLCVILAFHFAHRIFDSRIRAWAYTAGQLSAGTMLVFFGYVENHALLILATFAFTSAGMAYCRQRTSFVWVALAFILAVSFHFLGWSLLPALLYLLARRAPWTRRWRMLPRWFRAATTLVASGGAVVLLARLYRSDYAFRLMFLPPVKNRLTVDGYTLFSAAHLLDLLNLAFLLLPALAVALVFLTTARQESPEREPARYFLFWSVVATWLTAALLDPPLGMPRSWDRLAFAGVPLAAWIYYRLLSMQTPRAVTAALLCVSLSGCALASRAWVQVRPEASVKLAMSYFGLDPGRSRTGVITVGKYLLDHNTTAIYGVLEDFRRQHYPEEGLRDRLNFLFRDNKQLEAADVCQRIIRHDPRFASAWMFLGFVYNNAGHFDSAAAYLTVARGLDPHHTGILNELGRACYFTGQTERAVKLWRESLAEDSLQYVPHLALATWYKVQGNAAEATRHLAVAASRPGAPGDTFLELASDHAEQGRGSEARAAYEQAVARGADSAKAAALLQAHPELGPPVTGTSPPR